MRATCRERCILSFKDWQEYASQKETSRRAQEITDGRGRLGEQRVQLEEKRKAQRAKDLDDKLAQIAANQSRGPKAA